MVGDRGRAKAVVGDRPGRDIGDLPGARIPAADASAEARSEHDVGVDRVGDVVVALVAADRVPVAHVRRAIIAAAGDPDGAAVLLPRIDPVREAVVGREVIELAGRLVVPAAPAAAAVDRDCGALVGAFGHASGILRVDPDRMVIVAAGAAAEDHAMRAALVAAAHRLAGEIDDVGVSRIGGDAVEVVIGESATRVDALPVVAAVVRAPKAAVGFGVDVGIDAQMPALTGCGEADASERSRRPAAAR